MTGFMLFTVQILHYLILGFVLIGWALPTRMLLLLHSALIPALFLHWWTNNNECMLTNVENALLRQNGVPAKDAGQGFIQRLLVRTFGKSPQPNTLNRILYLGMTFLWALGLYRLSRL